jgi:hypothetical protein
MSKKMLETQLSFPVQTCYDVLLATVNDLKIYTITGEDDTGKRVKVFKTDKGDGLVASKVKLTISFKALGINATQMRVTARNSGLVDPFRFLPKAIDGLLEPFRIRLTGSTK